MIISKLAYRICRWLFPLLSDREYARLQEKRSAITRMDFPDAEIIMSARSRVEMARAQACSKEPETVEWLKRELRPGDTLYDIGGNAGAYSLVSLHCGVEDVRAVIMEPASANYELLVRNCILNQVHDRVITLPVALGADCSRQELHYSKYTSGAASHSIQTGPGKGVSETILVYSLDALIGQFSLPAPNLIKLDTDGFEPLIIRGARQTLARPELRSLLIELDVGSPEADSTLGILEEIGWTVSERHPRDQNQPTSGLENIILTKTTTPPATPDAP
jgi:FkbM family methyltransferase